MPTLSKLNCKLIKCKWLPGKCADWFLDNIMTWSYFLHTRYSMFRPKNNILISELALNCEPVPLSFWKSPSENPVNLPFEKRTKKYNKDRVRILSIFSIFWWAKTNLDDSLGKNWAISSMVGRPSALSRATTSQMNFPHGDFMVCIKPNAEHFLL